MVKILKTYIGYTIDYKLREFRIVKFNKYNEPSIKFIPFCTKTGKKLLKSVSKLKI
jgi:hypothetical protein